MTKIVYLIGSHPSEYSKSPAMWNALFRYLGMDARYEALDVPEQWQLEDVLKRLKSDTSIAGFNVTIPYKEAIIRMLDKVDRFADVTKTVNTVKNEAGTLSGYTTDGSGAVMALLDNNMDIEGKTVLLLGAGGAARSIAFSLAERGAKLSIINRSAEKAVELAAEINEVLGAESSGGGVEKTEAALVGADIVINSTSLGMGDPEYANKSAITMEQASLAPRHAVFMDTVYSPMDTIFLKQAKSLGHKIIYGDAMLVNQAALAFEIIFDIRLGNEEKNVMKDATGL